jgi:prepilin-type N-terminal cleavage/methylation domain-containing protein
MNARGFTLVELLVVIGLLSLLFVALMPMINKADDTRLLAQCTQAVEQVASAAQGYANQRDLGDFPPDDFRDTRTPATIKAPNDNGINTGIESFLVFVNRAESREPAFPSSNDLPLTNTDADKIQGVATKLEKAEKQEVCDPWGNPLAYFHWRGYGKEQTYRYGEEGAGGDSEQRGVQAWRGKDGQYLNKRTFQVFSAGPDGRYGTGDDIGNFDTPQQDK